MDPFAKSNGTFYPQELAVYQQQVSPLVSPVIVVSVVADKLVDQFISFDLRFTRISKEFLYLGKVGRQPC